MELVYVLLLTLTLAFLGDANTHSGSNGSVNKKNKVVLIGIDGLRHDFYKLSRDLPNLFALSRAGVRSEVVPPFPADSLSVWTTLMTGLYTESHGMTDFFYDPATRKTFRSEDGPEDSKRFNSEEPVWRTNEIKGRAGSKVISWVANSYKIQPINHSSSSKILNDSKNLEDVQKEFSAALANPDITFILLHIVDIVSRSGSAHGPQSAQYREALEKMDEEILGSIVPLIDIETVNVILTGDHGIVSSKDADSRTSGADIEYLDDYLDPETYRVFLTGGSATLSTLGSTTVDDLYKKLQPLRDMSSYRVFRKDEIPKYLHYRYNRRLPDILILANKGHLISKRRNNVEMDQTSYHNYDTAFPEMSAAFIGVGPAFKQGALIDKFDMVDIYPLMTHLLGIKPNKNNGSLDSFNGALTHDFMAVDEEFEKDYIAASSVFRSRGGVNISGVIYFSQQQHYKDIVNVRLRLVTNRKYANFYASVRESGDIFGDKACAGSMGRIATVLFPSAYEMNEYVTTLEDGTVDIKTQMRGISLYGDNSILGRTIVIESNGNLPTKRSLVSCGIIASIPMHIVKRLGLVV